mgnify:FL=1
MDFDVKLACKAESMSNSPSDGHPSFLAGYAGQEDTPSALLQFISPYIYPASLFPGSLPE